ncbi:MAG: transglutaminase [Planctomycetaceae bacterium]|nr:transglutaminase [Planctomycetaceae bacterium]
MSADSPPAAARFRIRHTTKYSYTDPAPVCHNALHLMPRTTPWQQCRAYRLAISPEPAEKSWRTDLFDNRVDYFSVHEPHRGMAITAHSEVEVQPRPGLSKDAIVAWDAVAEDLRSGQASREPGVVQFRFPSQQAPIEAQIGAYAAESLQPGRSIVEALRELTQRIHADFRFDPKATNVSTPVHEVFEKRAGVCQDFAHLQISCLRSLGLAARYVSGYLRTLPPPGKPRLIGADASHAWVSAYCGAAGWIDFDPTNDVMPNEGPALDHVTVAYGRDYADVCPIQGVFVGGGQHTMSVEVDVMPLP